MKYLTVFLLFTSALFSLLADTSMETEKTSLAHDFFILMNALKKENPVLYQKIESMDRQTTLSAIMRQLNTGISPVSADKNQQSAGKDATAKNSDTGEAIPGCLIAKNRILYIRIENWNKKTQDRLYADLIQAERQQIRPIGVIFDLRTARGNKQADAVQLANHMTGNDELAPDNKFFQFYRSLPIFVLTSRETCGSPELLAYLIQKSGHGCVIGTEGKGEILEQKMFTAGNYQWRIPVLPNGVSEDIFHFSPKIQREPGTQISMKEISNAENLDPVLQYAIDLVLTKNALNGIK